MKTIRYPLMLCFALAFGCGGSSETAPRALGDPDHNTLGTWPNVVVDVNSQKTAADLLYEILDEAVKDAGTPALDWPQFKMVVDRVQQCGRNAGTPAPPTYTAHAAKLQSALTNAKLHTLEGWTACTGDLDHGH